MTGFVRPKAALAHASRIALAALAVLMVAAAGLGFAATESSAAPPPACPDGFELSDDHKRCVRPAEAEQLETVALPELESLSQMTCSEGVMVAGDLCAVSRIDTSHTLDFPIRPTSYFTG